MARMVAVLLDAGKFFARFSADQSSNKKVATNNTGIDNSVVVHGVEVLEVGQLDSDSHEQHETGRGETVGEHPEVTQVHSVQILGGLLLSAVTVGGKNRGENHQKERAQGHGSDLTTEPQDLTVSDQDNGQVLEDRVDVG